MPQHKYTLEEYFDLIQTVEGRWEYGDGELFDMSGASQAHYAIERNFIAFLKLPLAAKGCTVFPSNAAINVPSLPPFRFSDFAALCGPATFEKIGGIDVLMNPALIVENLPKTTEAHDRGDKFSPYKSILSFCEYLLVAQHRPHVSHFICARFPEHSFDEALPLSPHLVCASKRLLHCRLQPQSKRSPTSCPPNAR